MQSGATRRMTGARPRRAADTRSLRRAAQYLTRYGRKAILPYAFLIIATLAQLAVPNMIRRILDATPVPVVPMALQGLWGSFFSRKDGAAMTKPWRLQPFARIGLQVGAPVPPALATLEALQAEVLGLRGGWK